MNKLPSFGFHWQVCDEPTFSGVGCPGIPSSEASLAVSRVQGSVSLSESPVPRELVAVREVLLLDGRLVVVAFDSGLAWPEVDPPQAVMVTSVAAAMLVKTMRGFTYFPWLIK
jgi:hypothetical protein